MAYKYQEGKECQEFAQFLITNKIPFMRIASEIPSKSFGIINQRKKEGFQAGYPDFFVFAARGKYHGLAVEMKSLVGNFPTMTGKDPQHEFLKSMARQDYATYVTKGAESAIFVTELYLKEGKVTDIMKMREGKKLPQKFTRCYNQLCQQ